MEDLHHKAEKFHHKMEVRNRRTEHHRLREQGTRHKVQDTHHRPEDTLLRAEGTRLRTVDILLRVEGIHRRKEDPNRRMAVIIEQGPFSSTNMKQEVQVMSEISQTLVDMLIRHEGLRLKPYTDTVGKMTVGVGRNLTDVGISKQEAMYLLHDDIQRVQAELAQQPWFSGLNEARQMALTDMAFNLGLQGLLGFKKAIEALQGGDFQAAATEMLNSKWAGQVGARAQELANIVRTGELAATE